MSKFRSFYKHIIILLFSIFLLINTLSSVEAQILLSPVEKEYVPKEKIITAASIDGVAPLNYRNSKGEITGIAVSTLDKISEMTGLKFEYKLYDTIDDVFESKDDLVFGISSHYTRNDMVLSDPYLFSETIVFLNSTVDASDLQNKIFAGISGAALPDNIKEENTIYFDSRKETLDAVDQGKADYGYGNDYSIAYYSLQENYKNIISVPKAKESRAYSIGFLKEDPILLSIINKSIGYIDDNQMNSLILEVASQIDKRITLSMLIDSYGVIIFGMISLIIGLLFWGFISNYRAKKQQMFENDKHELLASVSNDYLFEYNFENKNINLTKKSRDLFGSKENIDKVIRDLEEIILNEDPKNKTKILALPLKNGMQGIFKVIYSTLHGNKGQLYYIVGKLINISDEFAEKQKLITISQIDGLPGIYNAITSKRFIKSKMIEKDKNQTDALILIDCDNFKEINDNLGHLKGDEALINVSTVLTQNFHENDVIGCIGGDSFAFMCKIFHPSTVLLLCAKKRFKIFETKTTNFILK